MTNPDARKELTQPQLNIILAMQEAMTYGGADVPNWLPQLTSETFS